MRVSGRIRQRLTLAIVLTALLPVIVAITMAQTAVHQAGARFYLPEIGAHLDRSLGLYQDLARSVKALMREEAATIAESGAIRRAARAGDQAALKAALAQAFKQHPSLALLAVRDASGRELARVERERPIDPATEHRLEVVRPLADGEEDDVPSLLAVFGTSRARFDELAEMSQFVDTYRQIEKRRGGDEKSYVFAFALLLGITIVAAIGVGVLLARGVSRRITELAAATQTVATGNLSIRVPVRGNDEVTNLARAFNAMLSDVAESRARIEYLQRIGAWQEMARRLAHEIKNPLTPIQLAVQEVHRRYEGADPTFRRLLETTREIVEDEVGTLRRLVSEFSDFARLPQARLEPEDLTAFLAELSDQLSLFDDETRTSDLPEDVRRAWSEPRVGIEFALPPGEAQVAMDRQMLRRVLLNLIQNAAQAARDQPERAARVRVSLRRDGDFFLIDVEDNGPGIPLSSRERVFEPYVTTKPDGTGLGLAIVKKIVVEHGGMISVLESQLGGALLRLRFPRHVSEAIAPAKLSEPEHEVAR